MQYISHGASLPNMIYLPVSTRYYHSICDLKSRKIEQCLISDHHLMFKGSDSYLMSRQLYISPNYLPLLLTQYHKYSRYCCCFAAELLWKKDYFPPPYILLICMHIGMLGILFLSNHNIHKSSFLNLMIDLKKKYIQYPTGQRMLESM